MCATHTPVRDFVAVAEVDGVDDLAEQVARLVFAGDEALAPARPVLLRHKVRQAAAWHRERGRGRAGKGGG